MLSEDLKQLLALFQKTKHPLTARKIAEETETYPATALRRVLALQKYLEARTGKQVRPIRYREGRRGPASAAWVLM